MRIGLSSHTYPWAVGVPGLPSPERRFTAQNLLGEARRLGARVVQFGDNIQLHTLTPGEIDSIAAAAASSHIEIQLGASSIDAPTLRLYLELAQQLDARLVCMPLPANATLVKSGDVERILENVADLLPRYEAAGVAIAIENSHLHPAAVYGEVLRQLPSKNLAMCLDTASSLGHGESVSDLVAACGERVACVQMRDVCVQRDASGMGFRVQGCPAGEGIVDLPGVLRSLAVAGVSLASLPLIVMQWTPRQVDIMETIALERAWAETSMDTIRRIATSAIGSLIRH